MKKFNFKNGKEKLVEKANNVKEKCVGYVDDHSTEIWAFATVLGVGLYGVWIGTSLEKIHAKGFNEGLKAGLNIYNDTIWSLTEMSKESN